MWLKDMQNIWDRIGTRDGNGYAAKEFWLMANRQVLATAQLAKTANIFPKKYVTFEAEKHDKQVYTISYELRTPFSPSYLMYFVLISCFFKHDLLPILAARRVYHGKHSKPFQLNKPWLIQLK